MSNFLQAIVMMILMTAIYVYLETSTNAIIIGCTCLLLWHLLDIKEKLQ